ncbi:hypothetical protein P691DRAFT_800130 [Macrolepiota fuliginosa MF-IS2]|uniref:Uncharacterized protein n=1 Tax=Macrolepiota fuliginosa MF-IS2 TaxID=1400762 RepID=A0A9P6CAL1_9AGAR|nr:hypothetical protein P691DRAFT_800130 [Macrolepiota fuliginosa MF-IS2]
MRAVLDCGFCGSLLSSCSRSTSSAMYFYAQGTRFACGHRSRTNLSSTLSPL